MPYFKKICVCVYENYIPDLPKSYKNRRKQEIENEF